ncbi:MAG TPA: hypothetical protein VF167_04000 [Longimicrobiaceae bacterium]
MDTHQPPRERHPVRGLHQALENYGRICEARGYCGPFINEEFYNAFPDPMWRGCGECVVCGSTCLVAHEEEKRRIAEGLRAEVPPAVA